MLTIIGLGNPGEKYHYTRHNIAWLVFDKLLSDGWNFNKYMNAETAFGNQGVFIKPQTFMNRSGEVVNFLKKESDFNSQKLVIVYDDIDLAFGTVRISYDRGDGGHNGMKSIIEHLGSKECVRIRIGISKQLENGQIAKPNVLGVFPENEREIIANNISKKVEDILQSLVDLGLEKTMNKFNVKQT